MFAACLAHGEQTNHCKMTMVWWENDVSILLCHCRCQVARSRDRLCRYYNQGSSVGAVRVSLVGSGDLLETRRTKVREMESRRKKSSGSDIG